ncbi:hypothetical protein GIB67_038408 [Kingdonia uniflora]|uniref:DFDF domain-containing protein n=1 Tax=Kingdonia uniflora TaxID=39325 RepID=A0A7J7NNZ5_9MAGN|nr:hypothetical protein GIB67_038408 [Kingdonia uniflora]
MISPSFSSFNGVSQILVKSYGTEGRKKEGSQILSSDVVHGLVLFKASDIKDMNIKAMSTKQVKPTPPVQIERQIHDDPAIVQIHSAHGGARLESQGSHSESYESPGSSLPHAQQHVHFTCQIPVSSASLPSDISSSLTNTPFLPSPNQHVKGNPTKLTPDQFKQPGLLAVPSTQTLHTEKRHMETMEALLKPLPSKVSPTQGSLLSFPPSKPSQIPGPLLPLPHSSRQSQLYVTQFTEEFDFIAMNEKFNKDEVWGHLGQVNQRNETEGNEINSVNSTMGDYNGHRRTPDAADIKTFGEFEQQPLYYRGGRGFQHRGNYRGSHNRGRGYDYGGMGRGGNTPAKPC